MALWNYIFFISCFILFYNYFGYAVIIYLINLFNKQTKKETSSLNYFPTVSFIVAAYNEQDCIEQKIKNSLEQEYPKEMMEFIFITDGSTDRTNEIITQFPAVKLLYQPERGGKSAALNRAVLHAKNDILIFSDSNAFLNKEAVRNITRHYISTNVGGVAGEKKVVSSLEKNHAVQNSEGLYWKYESLLKKIDSDFYSVVGAAGELFSLRRNLYESLPASVILDDFIISMQVAQKGFRIVYDPQAYAAELPSFSIAEEQKRKVRIAAGGFQAMQMLSSVFRFWENPKLFFLYISHRVLRWTLSPISLFLMLISNITLVFKPASPFYITFFIFQVTFYTLAFLAYLLPQSIQKFKLARLSYYFVFMNLSVILGFFRFMSGKQSSMWEKAKRA